MIMIPNISISAVNVDRTRIIFASADMSQSINLSNDNENSVLVQAWTDDGDTNSSPDDSKTPVVIVPPVFRMQQGEIRSLRLILSSRQMLPTNVESSYWLNIFQIPPTKESHKTDEHKVVLPLRLRIKIFIRPVGIKEPTDLDFQKIKFSRQDDYLRIYNPTVWHMSLSLRLPQNKEVQNIMISPKSSLIVPEKIGMSGTDIKYGVIDDAGNLRNFVKQID